MEPITIGILCAIGGALLSGGAVYAVEENDKGKLREKNKELQAAVERLGREQERLRRTVAEGSLRELNLCLTTYSQKLENLQALGRASLSDYLHVHAIVNELEGVSRKLHSGTAWTPEESRFVAAVAVSLDTSKVLPDAEARWLSGFVFDRNAKSVAEMTRRMLSRRARQAAGDLRSMKEDLWGAEHLRDSLTKRAEVEGLSDVERVELDGVKVRIDRFPKRIRSQERLLETIKVLLVVVTRLDAASADLDEGDRAVERILERLVRGDQITAADQKLLLLYTRKHFGGVRGRIERETGISLLTWDDRRSTPEA